MTRSVTSSAFHPSEMTPFPLPPRTFIALPVSVRRHLSDSHDWMLFSSFELTLYYYYYSMDHLVMLNLQILLLMVESYSLFIF